MNRPLCTHSPLFSDKLSPSIHIFDSLSQNLSEGKYKTFEEFKADAQLIVHNTAILYGGKLYTREYVDLCGSHCRLEAAILLHYSASLSV